MARSAIKHASPTQREASILELHNAVWAQPIVVAGNKQVHIALRAGDNDEIEYEIYSQEGVHGQGRAVWSHEPAPTRLDLEQLKRQMERGQLEPGSVYARLAQMGLYYGPAHQGIKAIYVGEKQLLAQLRLPAVLETGHAAYVLHPSLMDSALQASIGLMVDLNHVPNEPSVLFALESLRILSSSTNEMVAWVRYAEGSQAEDDVVKLDIDLCDERGNVCTQMRGVALRSLEGETKSTDQKAMNETTDRLIRDKAKSIEDNSRFDPAFYQTLIADVLNRELSVDEAVELG